MIEHVTGDDDQRLLERFAEWLRETRDEADGLDRDGRCPPEVWEAADGLGTLRLVEAFTALRHEVKLQTKSGRGLEEQAQALHRDLEQAVAALRSIEPKESQAAYAAAKPLALALAELDEALERGRMQTQRAVERLTHGPRDDCLNRLTEFHQRQPWLEQIFCASYYQRFREWLERERASGERLTLFEALLDGYRLIQNRLAQALRAEGIARIDCVGRPVDPEQMIVIDVVDVDDRPGGVVYDEIRRGYTWKGRLLRCAEVRATRSSAAERPPGEW